MADTTIAECHYCHEETDCIINENGRWMCSGCFNIELEGEIEYPNKFISEEEQEIEEIIN